MPPPPGHRRSSFLLFLPLVVMPKATVAFLSSARVRTRTSRPFAQRPDAPASSATQRTSLWQRVFPASAAMEQKLNSLQECLDAVEQQRRREVAELQARIGVQEAQEQLPAGPSHSGTWTVDVTNQTSVQSSPAFDLGGFPFCLVLTETAAATNERPIGLYLQYLPSAAGSDVLALPSVQCRFTLLDPVPLDGEGGYESLPTRLDGAGGALGLDAFALVSTHSATLQLAFEVTLRSVHFPGRTERAKARTQAWERTYNAVETHLQKARVEATTQTETGHDKDNSKPVWAPSTLFTRPAGESTETGDAAVQKA